MVQDLPANENIDDDFSRDIASCKKAFDNFKDMLAFKSYFLISPAFCYQNPLDVQIFSSYTPLQKINTSSNKMVVGHFGIEISFIRFKNAINFQS